MKRDRREDTHTCTTHTIINITTRKEESERTERTERTDRRRKGTGKKEVNTEATPEMHTTF
jgi:hypothetical protein